MQQSVLGNCEVRDQVVTIQNADGRQLALYGSAVPLHNERGEIRGSVGCFVDVTARVEAENALRESEQRLRLAVTASGIGYWSWNLESGVLDLDERTAEIFGVSIDDPVTVLFDRIIDEDRERVQREVQATTAGQGRFRSEFRVAGDGAAPRWVSSLGDIFWDTEKQTMKFSGVSFDISERKRIEDEHQRFVSLVENSTEFIGMCDLEGMPFYFNEAGLRMVGLDSLEQALRIPVEEFIFPEDRDFLRNEFHPKVVREGRGEVELRFRHFKTGEARWMIHTVFPVRDRDGNTVGLATVNRDITERKYAEQLLKDADRRKDEFLATLGHELRNPLAPISNALQILPSVENQPQHVRRLGELMGRQVEQLKHLIDDLLDVSRISRGKIALRREKLDLRDAISSAVEVARPLIDARGHELCIELPSVSLPIDGDSGRLMQVFGNLLHNAAKYTDPNGRIELSLRAEDGRGVVSIRDTGSGIPPEMLGSIFEAFTQVSGTLDRSQGGLGIGLTLVKTLVELHGGIVEARSEGVGKGSEFIVRLPLLEAHTGVILGELPGRQEARLALHRHRVLVVDDLKPSADTLAMLLESLGQDICVAYSAASALEQVERFQPDLVVSDIAMPGMDGYQLAQEVRHACGEKPLLVALTGYGQEHDRMRAHEAGFNRHLVKPASVDALRDLLESVGFTG
jgi:PAS domain S-box-containing protein